jgi:hypothetical protein
MLFWGFRKLRYESLKKKVLGSVICDKSNFLSASFYLGAVVKNKAAPIVKGHTMLCVKK